MEKCGFFTRILTAHQITRIAGLLASSETRLLTLTGPGGTGKTRLGIEAAGRFCDTFPDAVWFVPLADLSDPGLIPQTILESMGIPLMGNQEPQERLVAALTRQPTLLLLDNFEQLVAGGPEMVQTLLSQVPTLQCLVTSRQTLNLPGEVEFAVPPLPIPNGTDTPEQLGLFESVRLFVDRAQAAKPDFRITSGNAPAVAELCDRLEGIPLAIELAAARAQVLTPGQMLVQLGKRFEFLVSRKRGVVARQRTLRAAVDWSYRLLAPEMQQFFAQLSVFRGGWTAEAAETVCEASLSLDMLAQLRECSLVTTEESGGSIRFRMLESLREYAGEQLSAEESVTLRERHAAFFTTLADAGQSELKGSQRVSWLSRLDSEQDNLRTALTWRASEAGDAEQGMRLAGALRGFWIVRGHLSEGREHLERLSGRAGNSGRTVTRAKALRGAGELAWFHGDYEAARRFHEESLAIYRERQDNEGAAAALTNAGSVARERGDFATARALFSEALALYEEAGLPGGIANMVGNLGDLLTKQGDFEAARPLCEQGLSLYRELGDAGGIVVSLGFLGVVCTEQGDYETARTLYAEAIKRHQASEDRWGIAWTLEGLAALSASEGQWQHAARLWGAAQGLRENLSAPMPPSDRPRYNRLVTQARAALKTKAFDAAWEKGRALTGEQAAAYALERSL